MKKKYMKPEMTKVVPACPEFLDNNVAQTSQTTGYGGKGNEGEEAEAKQRDGVWGDSRKDLLWDF